MVDSRNREAQEALRRYADEVRAILTARAEGIRAYIDEACRLIPEDAERRLARVIESMDAPGATQGQDLGPVVSVLDIAELEFTHETRHSLVLAWLLDPIRSGPIAVHFWKGLISLLGSSIREEQRGHTVSLGQWKPEYLHRLEVDPKSHGAEWEHLDVFARVQDERGYHFGLVIENKVRKDTSARKRQLSDYFDLIVNQSHWDDARQKTVFLYLTESRRPPEEARKEIHKDWFTLGWVQIVDLLDQIAGEEKLQPAERVLLRQYGSVIRRNILGTRTDYEDRLVLWMIRDRVDRPDTTESDWRELHGQICHLERVVNRR